jgi:transcriptional regulator of arginine metabolism
MNKHSSVSEITRRREEILRIVRKESVHSQEELQTLLHRSGFEATQPTLSRDIRELGLVKTPNGYAAVGSSERSGTIVSFVTPESREHRLHQALAEFAVSVDQAGNLVVIRTTVGGAQPLAVAIDAAAVDEIVGTIAGDDTIFLAIRSASAAGRLVRQLRQTFTHPRRERRARA